MKLLAHPGVHQRIHLEPIKSIGGHTPAGMTAELPYRQLY